jgi:hypothetical protein
MRSIGRGRAGALVALLGLGLAAGCYAPHLGVYLFGPQRVKEEVEAEHLLQADRLAIVIYAGNDVLFTYPTVPIEISSELVYEITRHMKDRIGSFVHPAEVVRWQESTLEWPTLSLVEVGRRFGADTVLYVELVRYTLVEEKSANLFRGRVKSRVHVLKAEAERNPVYETTVEVTFPEDQPIGVLGTSERRMRQGTNKIFAQELARKFYDHEIEVKGEGP